MGVSCRQKPRHHALNYRWGFCSFMEMMGCLMETGITAYNLPREFYVLQINGRITSTHRRYQDALRAGLLLKHQFPHGDIKLCEMVCETDQLEGIIQQRYGLARDMVRKDIDAWLKITGWTQWSRKGRNRNKERSWLRR